MSIRLGAGSFIRAVKRFCRIRSYPAQDASTWSFECRMCGVVETGIAPSVHIERHHAGEPNVRYSETVSPYYPKSPTILFRAASVDPETPTIDHESEALRFAAFAKSAGSEAVAITGLVHATLYAAKQQRIANLIAWQQLTGGSNRAEIRKGLGL